MVEPSGNDTSGGAPRAPRFAIQMPVRYRVCGQVNWYEGRAENISRSGVLFRGQRIIEPLTSIEMSFVLPVEASTGPPPR